MGRAGRTFIVVVGVAIVAYPLTGGGVSSWLLYDVVGLGCAAAMAVATLRRAPSPARGPWLLIAGGVALLSLADFVFGFIENVQGRVVPLPSIADAIYLTAYPVLALGVFRLSRLREAGSKTERGLDAAIGALGVGVLVWHLVVAPAADDPSVPLLGRMVVGSYPLLDVVVLAFTLHLAMTRAGRLVAFRALASALVLLLGADLVYAYLQQTNAYEWASWLDLLWLGSYAAFAVAALHPSADELGARSEEASFEGVGPVRTLLLAMGLLVGPGILAWHGYGSEDLDLIPVASASGLLGALVIWRITIALRAVERTKLALALSEQRFRSLVQHASDLVVVLDRRGTLVYVAPSVVELFDYDVDALVGEPATSLVHPDDAPVVDGLIERVEDLAGVVGGLEVRLRDGRGVWRWTEVRYSNRLDDPSVEGVVLNIRDITDRHAVEVALREREAQYHSFFDANAAPMLLLDPSSGAIVDANPAAARYYGHDRERLALMRVADLRADDESAVLAEMRAASDEGRAYLNVRHRLASGEIRYVEVYTGSIAHGGRHLVYEIVHDVTERRRAQEAERAAEHRYRALAEQLPLVTYVVRYDPDDATIVAPLYVSPQIEDILGVTPEAWVDDPSLWGRMIHREDRERVEGDGAECRATRRPIETEYRMWRRDGRLVWLRDSSVPVAGEDGATGYWQGIYQDVTEEHLADAALRESEERFRAVFDDAAIGIVRLSTEGEILQANDAFATLLGYSQRELVGTTAVALLAGDARTMPLEFHQLVEGSRHRYETDRQYLRSDGSRVWCHVVVSLVHAADGAPAFAIAMLEDIDARKAAEDALAHRALHDPLTALPNRDLLMDRLGVATARLDRGGPGLAVLFLDLDGFKAVNDAFGHAAGDRVLVEAATRLRSTVRPSDTVGRIGGDEFVVLCEDVSNVGDAMSLAERISDALSTPFLLPDGVSPEIGVSIGITLAARAARPPADLIREADAAMYQAKRAGGRATRVYGAVPIGR